MDEHEEEEIKNIVSKLDRDVKLPPYDNESGSGYSRDYQKYKQEEVEEQELNSYEKLCIKAGDIINIKSDDSTREKLSPPLRLLGWEVSPGMVISASVLVGFGFFMVWGMLFGLNMILGGLIPTEMMLLLGVTPIVAGIYTFLKPKYDAKSKVIESSGEMILSVLYMVVYMRSSPNLEGAIRFAALNLNGSISDDLKRVLWNVEVGNYSDVGESLEDYTKTWKGYNEDYLQSLQMLEAAMNEPNDERREQMLQDSIDNILEGTQEKMKHYAQGLKTPVMILNAMGAMLPVLGMIMLPLISVFMGGAISSVHLVMLFNLMLPASLWWFMQRLLTSRPPTTSSKPVDESYLPRSGKVSIGSGGSKFRIPSWVLGGVAFLIISFYGWVGYLAFPHFYPIGDQVTSVPDLFGSAESPSPLPMLLRSLSITVGLGVGIGVSKYLGNKKRRKKIQELRKIDEQFPDMLFQLGNKVSGGTPIEVALKQAAVSAQELEISGLFEKASENIRRLGMTFEDAFFDPSHGAIKRYPSQTIQTVMKAISRSSSKGTNMAAVTMMTISRYLQNIHQTQETLNDLLEDTTTTLTMLSYLLAPVVSAIAVGMSQTIMTAMFKISKQFAEVQTNQAPSSGLGFIKNIDGAIPPETLQFVVGIYLIQLLYILGTFFTKITEGENETYKNLYIGKVTLIGLIIYGIVITLVSWLFGGVVSSVTSA